MLAPDSIPNNYAILKELLGLVQADMEYIHENWDRPGKIIKYPEGRTSDFNKEAKRLALVSVHAFTKNLLRNKNLAIGPDMFSLVREIVKAFAKMFYIVEEPELRDNALDILTFVNEHPRYNKLLADVQNPAG